MQHLQVIRGSAADYPLQVRNRGGQSTPAFGPLDTLSCYLYPGSDQVPTLVPSVDWYTFGGTQTGYDQGQVIVSLSADQSATLEANGTYTCLVWWTSADSGEMACIVRFALEVLPAAGLEVRAVAPYCTLDDMLTYAQWIAMVQDLDVNQEGFYEQRLRARQWLDLLVIQGYRGTSASYFGDQGRPASQWSGSWAGRSAMPSSWIIGQLQGGFFPQYSVRITSGGSQYGSLPAVSIAAPPASPGSASASFSAMIDATGRVTAITVNSPGVGYVPGRVYPLAIDPPGPPSGTAATAVAVASAGTLIVRSQVVQACAYKAISLVGLTQVGVNNQLAQYGAYYDRKADVTASTLVAELDYNGDGIADVAIPLGVSNTIYT